MIENLNQNEVVETETTVNDTNSEVKSSEDEKAEKQRLIQERLAAIQKGADVKKDQPVEVKEPLSETAEKKKVEAKVEEPEVEAPKVEESKVKEPTVEEPKAETPKAEEPTVEEPEVETPKVEEPAVEEPEADEPTIEASQVEEEKVEEVKSEEIVSDEKSEDEKSDIAFTADLDIEVEEDDAEEVDYSEMEKAELVNAIKDLVENVSVIEIKDKVEQIKTSFYKKHNAENAERRKKFLEAGGDLAEYKIEPDAAEHELKEFYKQYKDLKTKHNEEIEKEKADNLARKYEIIEKIKLLTERDESLNNTFQEFKDLQQQWREIGPVTQTEIKNLWQNYNYQIEKFYDYIKINKELRDLDLKKNMEAKMLLCEKAEELLLEPNILVAFKDLQKYHGQWRDIGPIPREKRDEIWERFKEVTTKINKKHQEYFEKRKEEEKNNLKAKILLCEKAEEIADISINGHKEWDEKSKEVVELQKIWKLIGFVPRKDSNKVYERFREACDSFFNNKREFYSKAKNEQDTNLQLKTELCIQAEALKDSTEWKKTTDEYIRIQQQWKTIGPVSRKHSDAIWKRFRTACNTFFDRKSEHFSSIDDEQAKNLIAKKELIDKINACELQENPEDTLVELKSFQKQWTEIGHVPFKNKDEIQKQYREAINSKFSELDLDETKRSELKFASRLKNMQGTPKSGNKMRFEREKLHTQLERVRSDIQLWENNIGFFAKSKNAESLIRDVKNKIEAAKRQEESIIDKISMMDKYNNEQ